MKHYFESDVHHHSENGSETRISKSREQMLWEAALALLPQCRIQEENYKYKSDRTIEERIAASAFSLAETMVKEFERRVG